MGRSRDLADGTLSELNVDSNTLAVDATNNRVGIGTASPSQQLEVAGNVLLSNNQYVGVKDTTGAAVGFPIYTGSNDAIFGYLASGSTGISTYQFRTGNNTERMRILSSGGITFNGDTAAANALDDYEEGTWTPGIGGRSFSSVYGIYRKIGNAVFISFSCNTMSGGSITNGSLTGLPFAATNSSNIDRGGWITISEPTNFTLSSGYTYVYSRVDKNSTDGIILQGNGSNHNSGVTIDNNANFRGNGFYLTD